ncbi:DUF1674 domain-containing protein [Aurantiacibacter spongiae]|uniref:DUF1674 domain-containing protein n=1 Tax=Aurantiacibacter spongiae TaxID=2488860 RepID=A0A3N5DK59_9SPHN|nr:DUF1674 domain-containing protein [Aurantiacibacter spongiae]RPF71135.1 DUF1674 domain-containing protein [Aurantiacibacter spongiae]
MTDRSAKRPQGFVKPDYWTDDPPPRPNPATPAERAEEKAQAEDSKDGLSPTRYGDWVIKGIAIDF